LNLYTNGKANEDPFTLYYGIKAAPTIMIIDPRGNIFNYNNYELFSNNKETFIKALEEAMK
jgi:hypothetical protein